MEETTQVTIYGLANCDRCRAARRWLEAHAVPAHFVSIRELAQPRRQFGAWLEQIGPELINRRSASWRQLALRPAADAGPSEWLALLVANPTLARRPVTHWPNGTVTAGFSEDLFARMTGDSKS